MEFYDLCSLEKLQKPIWGVNAYFPCFKVNLNASQHLINFKVVCEESKLLIVCFHLFITTILRLLCDYINTKRERQKFFVYFFLT